jgi:hypothetical protein
MTIDGAGNVGIGSITPRAKLQVNNDSSSVQPFVSGYDQGTALRIANYGGPVVNQFANLAFYNGGTQYAGAIIQDQLTATTGTGTHNLNFYVNNNAGWVDSTSAAMTIHSSGNVGLGLTNPGKKLDVAGDIRASGTISGGNVIATYQDVAEWVPSGELLAPGTVVVLNRHKNNEVTPSWAAYDTAVAGVVSAQPGVLLGVPSAGKSAIATTGRVKVRVDAANRPVAIGDLLVTSGKTGMAMVSQPVDLGGTKIHRPGTIIGKALEPLASGEGEILVLLSLQ